MSSNPSSRWYWNDWENDLGLKLCSWAAQGMWMRMLSLAARSAPIGFVSVNGAALSTAELAALLGGAPEVVGTLLAELEKNHVFSRDRSGRIYNRRMVRDQKARILAVENGKKGGNPRLLQPIDKPDSNPEPVKGGNKGDRSAPIPLPLPLESKSPYGDSSAERRRDCAEMVKIWHAAGLPPILKLSSRRVQKCLARLRDDLNGSIEQWGELVQRIARSAFLCGNPGPWRADLDWVLEPRNLLRILEGKYDDRSAIGVSGGGSVSQRQKPTSPPPRFPDPESEE